MFILFAFSLTDRAFPVGSRTCRDHETAWGVAVGRERNPLAGKKPAAQA